MALKAQGKPAEAVAACREALRLQPDYYPAHNNLGLALGAQGKVAEAVAAYREALRLQPDSPQAHFNLGGALRGEGRFREALASLRKGHELGTRRPGWPSARTAADVRQAERLVELDRDLPAFLAGKRQPSGPEELLELAWLCRHPAKRLYAASARFSAGAFAARGARADDLRAGHRYRAACAAALAGCGQGEDAPGAGEKERARLRKEALGWLGADLVSWRGRLAGGQPAVRAEAQKLLQHWQQDPDLAGVRDKAALARLPAEERQAWQRLWADVGALLGKARPKE
jgi:hypothetical protein